MKKSSEFLTNGDMKQSQDNVEVLFFIFFVKQRLLENCQKFSIKMFIIQLWFFLILEFQTLVRTLTCNPKAIDVITLVHCILTFSLELQPKRLPR